MNQLHKIDNINNDFLQMCFFFLNCESTNVIDEKKPWKRCYYQFLWFFEVVAQSEQLALT